MRYIWQYFVYNSIRLNKPFYELLKLAFCKIFILIYNTFSDFRLRRMHKEWMGGLSINMYYTRNKPAEIKPTQIDALKMLL